MVCGCSGLTEINSSGTGTCTDPACTHETCGCQFTSVGSPTPYYNAAEAIQECHKQLVIQQQFATCIKNSNAFNMPACNQTAVVSFPSVTSIPIGSYLWIESIGYLKVISFDYLNSQVVVQNTCVDGNAAPGTAIAACSCFLVTALPGSFGTGALDTWPFLDVDFTVPAVGFCADITLTNINFIVVGRNVQIGTGQYAVSAIVSAVPPIIRICNTTGSGAVPGTVVYAEDGSGNHITPITPIDVNPCGGTAELTGNLIVCHSGNQVPLDCGAIGQVPVSLDLTGTVQFETLDVAPVECTVLTANVNLLAGTEQYTVNVLGVGIFATDYYCRFEGRTDTCYIVGSTPTTLTILFDPIPGAPAVIPAGTRLCRLPVADRLYRRVQYDARDFSANIPGTLDNIGLTIAPAAGRSSTVTSQLVQNLSYSKIMKFVVSADFLAQGWWEEVGVAPTDPPGAHVEKRLKCGLSWNTGALGATVAPVLPTWLYPDELIYHSLNYYVTPVVPPPPTISWPDSMIRNFVRILAINPRSEAYIGAQVRLEFVAGNIDQFLIDYMQASLYVIGTTG